MESEDHTLNAWTSVVDALGDPSLPRCTRLQLIEARDHLHVALEQLGWKPNPDLLAPTRWIAN